ncbi:MAG: NUMOD3 domain-containing DNA-binding protein, partial [Methanobacterium sp.]
MQKIYIYTLSDPITNAVKYVGKTTNMNRRYQTYMKESRKKNKNSLVITWIKSLAKLGLKPKMEIIDEIYGEWEWLEQYWISQFKTWGFKLKNMTDGGDYNPSNIPEVRYKISKALRGVKKSEEHKSEISKSKLGKSVHNNISKKKISDATIVENNGMYGKKHTIESLNKMKLKVMQYDLD